MSDEVQGNLEKEVSGSNRWPYARVGFAIALIALVLDQAHKLWMIKVWKLLPGQRLRVMPFFDVVFVVNPGVSYSLLSGLGQPPKIVFAGLAATALSVWILYAQSRWQAISLGLVVGGAIGNAIDRTWLGGVADFFSFHAGQLPWGPISALLNFVFNIADVAIVAGVAGLIYDSLVVSRKKA